MAERLGPRLSLLLLAAAALPAAAAESRIEMDGGVIEIHVGAAAPAPPVETLRRWVERAGRAVAIGFGRFPVARVRLDILGGRRRTGGGRTWCERDGARVRIGVESGADDAKLADDWVLTHEFVHLGFPEMPRDHAWMEEGLATYLEPVIRARAGQLELERVWLDFVEGCPKGVPVGGVGLDASPDWGPTYWGGATFWLLADLEIRERTRGQRSLDNALRGILAAFPEGNCAAGDVEAVIAAGDRATGLGALRDLHEQLGKRAFRPDFAELWKRLGVVSIGRNVVFDDAAPLSALRLAITAPPMAGPAPLGPPAVP